LVDITNKRAVPGALRLLFEHKTNKTTRGYKRQESGLYPTIYFTFIWNNDTPPYAHCVRFEYV